MSRRGTGRAKLPSGSWTVSVLSEIEDYGRRIEVLAEVMSVGIKVADYELLAACGALLAATRNRSEWTGAWL